MSGLSLLEHARAARPGVDDTNLVIDIASGLVDEMELEPPVDAELVASWQGIAAVEEAHSEWAGCLVPTSDGLIIRVRESDGWTRQRFTILHEVAHTFMPGFRIENQYRCLPGKPRDDIEALCDLAASELLMPRALVADYLAGARLGFDLVEDIAATFDASLEATARRVVTLWSRPALFVQLEHRTAPREPAGAEPKLRVEAFHAQGPWPHIPKHKSLDLAHPAYDALAGSEITIVGSLDSLCKKRLGDLEIHARSYPWINEGTRIDRVMLLATEAAR